MKVISTALPDIRVYEPSRFGDARGYFCEWYNSPDLRRRRPRPPFRAGQYLPLRRAAERFAACISRSRPMPKASSSACCGAPSSMSSSTSARARRAMASMWPSRSAPSGAISSSCRKASPMGCGRWSPTRMVSYKVTDFYDRRHRRRHRLERSRSRHRLAAATRRAQIVGARLPPAATGRARRIALHL